MSETIGDPVHAHVRPHAPVAPRRIEVAAAVILREGRLLLTQRPPGGPLGLQWELPGGKIEPGETATHAIVREIREELGVLATPRQTLALHTHDYPHGLEVEITFVECEVDSTDFVPTAAIHATAWRQPNEIDLKTVLEGDRDFLRGLAAGA